MKVESPFQQGKQFPNNINNSLPIIGGEERSKPVVGGGCERALQAHQEKC